MTSVTITTGSRLHFGPLSVAAPAGGRFGGVGVMIDSPSLEITAKVADEDSFSGDAQSISRVKTLVQRIRESDIAGRFAPCQFSIRNSIPSHCGFGSGTQLGLAVAQALSILANEPDPPLETLARRVGRGLRSAVGLHGYAYGGFLVDGGRADPTQLGTLVSRVELPEGWTFVLAMPRESIGLSGEAELSAFARQVPMEQTLTAELCRIVLMDWLPAAIKSDFDRFAAAMYEFGISVGQFFAGVQGGVFSHPRMAEWAAQLRRQGVVGIAQTSWGPTLAAICPDQKTAQQLISDFGNDPNWSDCQFQTAAPLNRGASVQCHAER